MNEKYMIKQGLIDSMTEEAIHSNWKYNLPVTHSALYDILNGLGLIDKDMSCEKFIIWVDSLQ